jgi:hypothetical protein
MEAVCSSETLMRYGGRNIEPQRQQVELIFVSFLLFLKIRKLGLRYVFWEPRLVRNARRNAIKQSRSGLYE